MHASPDWTRLRRKCPGRAATTLRARHAGFALAELLLVLVLSGVVLGAILAGLVALVRGLQPQAVVAEGETWPLAPTFAAFPSAVRLHQTLSERLSAARAVYVFGGDHVALEPSAAPRLLRALAADTLPQVADFSAGLPLEAHAFYERYRDALGPLVEPPAADAFSVVVIGRAGERLAVTCLVQVRRRDVTLEDGRFVLREVRLWETAGQPQRYAFAERASASASFVGAVHTWLRYEAATAAGEEGPACVMFPDPWLYAGARGQANDLPPFTRFSYFLAVSP